LLQGIKCDPKSQKKRLISTTEKHDDSVNDLNEANGGWQQWQRRWEGEDF